jgi:hypothetical protein
VTREAVLLVERAEEIVDVDELGLDLDEQEAPRPMKRQEIDPTALAVPAVATSARTSQRSSRRLTNAATAACCSSTADRAAVHSTGS